MRHILRSRRSISIALLSIILTGCGAPNTGSIAPSGSTTSASSIASSISNASEPSDGASAVPSVVPSAASDGSAPSTSTAATNQLIYYWPATIPQGMVIDVGKSSADETGFTLALIDPTNPQRTLDFYGGPGTPAMVRPPAVGTKPIEINGQQGESFSTGAGTSLHWDENEHPFRISGFFDRDEMLTIVNEAEALDLAQWLQRLSDNAGHVGSGGDTAQSELQYLWPSQLPEGFVIQPSQSTSDSSSFIVDVADTNTGQFWFTIVGGPNSRAAQPPTSLPRTDVVVRGQPGAAYTTGAGYSVFWQENNQPYAIIGGLGLDDALEIAGNLESLNLDDWTARRDGTGQ